MKSPGQARILSPMTALKTAAVSCPAGFATLRHRLRLGSASAGLALLLPALSFASSFKPEEGFGIGFALGTPSGLSASLPMADGTRAINALLGYRIGSTSALQAHADHVWVRGDLFEIERGRLSLFYGPGAYTVLSGSNSAVGIRFVVGIDYRFEGMPLQAFLEAGPGINVIPNTSASGSGGVGLRYYF